MALSLGQRAARGWMVVEISGEIDVGTAPQLRETLAELGAVDVIADLSGVDYLDSTGLGVLVGAFKRARARGALLRLVCVDGPIREVFSVTGLTRVFDIHSTLDDAARAPSAPAVKPRPAP